MELGINPELVRNIILRLREFQAKEEVVFPEDFNDQIYEDDMAQILADHEDDMTYQEVSLAVSDLEPDQQYELLALGMVGRGDYTLDEWDSALEDAQDVELENIPNILLATPNMPNFLKEALFQLGVDDE